MDFQAMYEGAQTALTQTKNSDGVATAFLMSNEDLYIATCAAFPNCAACQGYTDMGGIDTSGKNQIVKMVTAFKDRKNRYEDARGKIDMPCWWLRDLISSLHEENLYAEVLTGHDNGSTRLLKELFPPSEQAHTSGRKDMVDFMKDAEIVKTALAMGFSHAVPVRNMNLICEPGLRAYCNPEQCRNYGSTWVCPPGCGTIEECQETASQYETGIVLQTVSEIPQDDGMWEKLLRVQHEHNLRVLRLTGLTRSAGFSVLPLTTGGCIVCEACTFPDAPCREPERRMHSLSAYGIDVTKLSESAGLAYSFTEGIVYYTACLMIK